MARPPLLLINGYAATVEDWDPGFRKRLGESFDLLCAENRGVGENPLREPGESVTVEEMAADAEALLDRSGVERTAVLGWSMGGFVAQALALRSPRRVERLVLLATDPGPGAELCGSEVWEKLTDCGGEPRTQATRLISLLFPEPVAVEIDSEYGAAVAAARAALEPAGLRAQEGAMRSWHDGAPPRLPERPPPVLAAAGSEDRVIPPANLELLAELWPRCRVERFAGCGHALMAQEPRRLADLITCFVVE